ncbi:MAG: hypothetical protein RL211_225 [Pseudomonadota bacterium]
MTVSERIGKGLRTFASDVAQGFFELTHNSFALVGLAVTFACVTLIARPDIRSAGEIQLASWLQSRQPDLLDIAGESDAVERATATEPGNLPKQQASVAYWLSKKYRVAPEPLSALVAEAYRVGRHTKLEPTLILAVMAIESGFNPFAQSSVGAQGLMQVMTQVHQEKYEPFGGRLAAFDPVTNLRVGVKVLQECISRAGSIEGGLKFYVGAANLEHDAGYGAKVLAEYHRLQIVANGRAVPFVEPREASPPTADSIAVSMPDSTATLPAVPTLRAPVQPDTEKDKPSVPEKIASAGSH